MSAPWEALVSVAGGSVLGALLIVLAGYVGKRMFDRAVARSEAVHAAAQTRSLETHKAVLGGIAEEQKNLFTRSLETYKAQLGEIAEEQKSLLALGLETHRALLSQAAEEQKNLLAQAAAVDTDLRERRIPVYTRLWLLTRLLPKWPRAEGIKRRDLHSLSEHLRKWYFEGGGMFLSSESVEAYKKLQDELARFYSERQPLTEPITDEEYDEFRGYCSALRTELTNDIVSRRPSPLLAASSPPE
jgi:hypothetical protein